MAIDQLLFTPVATAMFYTIIKTMRVRQCVRYRSDRESCCLALPSY